MNRALAEAVRNTNFVMGGTEMVLSDKCAVLERQRERWVEIKESL